MKQHELNKTWEEQEMRATQREEHLRSIYPSSVRRLYDLAMLRTGTCEISASILRALHFKRGSIELSHLNKLDEKNFEAAFSLIEIFHTLSLPSDGGLHFDTEGKKLLSEEQIQKLLTVRPR